MKKALLFLSAYCAFGQNQQRSTIDFATSAHTIQTNDQQASPENVMALDPNSYDCSTVFWTVDYQGNVKQWNLINNQVTGGATVLTGAYADLAYVQKNGPTMYTNNFSPFCLKKCTPQTGWAIMPYSNEHILNFGGYGDNLYFMDSGSKLIHYNPTTGIANTIDTLVSPESFVGVADIAVDTAGRAWVFKGIEDVGVTQLRIYNSEGLIATFPISFDPEYMYGSFFLNDNLYIGRGTNNTIVRLFFNGATASLGVSIPFQANDYTDMASCNSATPLSTNTFIKTDLSVFPNPTTGIINLRTDQEILAIDIYDLLGKKISGTSLQNTVDLSELESGTYLLKATTENGFYNKFVIKN